MAQYYEVLRTDNMILHNLVADVWPIVKMSKDMNFCLLASCLRSVFYRVNRTTVSDACPHELKDEDFCAMMTERISKTRAAMRSCAPPGLLDDLKKQYVCEPLADEKLTHVVA